MVEGARLESVYSSNVIAGSNPVLSARLLLLVDTDETYERFGKIGLMTTQIDKVNKYYNSTVIDYKILWTGSKDLAMHFGYFDDGVKSHQESLIKMNEVLAKFAGIRKDDRVLDAGCGYGGTAMWLAQNVGCEVVGLTVVPYQVRKAQKVAADRGISNKASFHLQDYAHTSFPDSSFSVVWGLESIVHAENKKDFIKEAYRLLKKGGRLLIAEYTLRDTPSLTDAEEGIIAPWLKGWAMPDLQTAKEYQTLLDNVGFKNIKTHNITQRVQKSIYRLDKLQVLVPIAKFLTRIKLMSPEHYGNVAGGTAQSKALKMGLWQYTVIVAEKV